MSDAPGKINPNDEMYQRLGQDLADQLGRSDGRTWPSHFIPSFVRIVPSGSMAT